MMLALFMNLTEFKTKNLYLLVLKVEFDYPQKKALGYLLIQLIQRLIPLMQYMQNNKKFGQVAGEIRFANSTG